MKRYKGELAKPIPNGQTSEDIVNRKIGLLCRELNVDQGKGRWWQSLVMALVERHVPGFREAGPSNKTTVGRPKSLGSDANEDLLYDYASIVIAQWEEKGQPLQVKEVIGLAATMDSIVDDGAGNPLPNPLKGSNEETMKRVYSRIEKEEREQLEDAFRGRTSGTVFGSPRSRRKK